MSEEANCDEKKSSTLVTPRIRKMRKSRDGKDDRNSEGLSNEKKVVEVEKTVEIFLDEESNNKSQASVEDDLAKDALSDNQGRKNKKQKKNPSGPYLECRNRKRKRTLDEETESILTDRFSQSLNWDNNDDDQLEKKPEVKCFKPETIALAPKCVAKSTGGFYRNKKSRKSDKLPTGKVIDRDDVSPTGSNESSSGSEKRSKTNNDKSSTDSSKPEEVLVFAKKSPPPIIKSPIRSKPQSKPHPKSSGTSPDTFTTPRRPGPASKTGKTPSPPMTSSKQKDRSSPSVRKYHYSPHTITGKVMPR